MNSSSSESELQSRSSVPSSCYSITIVKVVFQLNRPPCRDLESKMYHKLLAANQLGFHNDQYEESPEINEDSTSASSGGLDGLPREDISGKITPTLLKGLESTDWKARLESIDAVNKVLEEANKRVQPNGTAELFGALRGRLGDNNKNLVMATLTCIGNVACAMGPAVEKASKVDF
ncbi:protein MOR1-like [Humulus lupulus]|uniref:protein MOR1-like n=1 Tax=Humulus lupulus TaxID=3486 RepID=UPI002B40B694|nr:protein MOR1-like [Humulus lupulus]